MNAVSSMSPDGKSRVDNQKTQLIPGLLRRLWGHINPRRRMQFGLLLMLMIFASLAEIVSIGVVLPFLSVLTAPEIVFNHPLAQPLVKALGLAKAGDLLAPLTIVFASAALFAGGMRLTLLWAQTRLSHAIGADLSFSIYRRTLYQPYTVHAARNSSEIIAGISRKTNEVVGNTLMPIFTLLSSALVLSAIILALTAIEPVVAFVAFVGFGAIYALVIFVTRKRLMQYSQRISREEGQVIKALQEGLGGIRDVLIDGTQATYCDIYRSADLPLRRAVANIQIIGGSPRYAIEALGMVLIAALAFSMTEWSSGLASAIPVLGAMALGAQRLLPVLQQAYSGWTCMCGSRASLSDALDLLDQKLPEFADAPLPEPMPFQRSITLNRISFRYDFEAPWVLRGVDLTIPKGSRIGFIGSTGSGKSTLLDIVMGLLQPTDGSLAIDDEIITSRNHRAWQAHIAHVPQAIFLADSTIAQNIAFGVLPAQIDYNRVRQAAQKAQVSHAIEAWKDQYETLVGERGVRLSGGQRQRIGIARALYKQANVIVFDEATSALDNDTERAVMGAIENLDDELTIFIVAHRLTTLKNCTQVIELADGKVLRSGSYQEIIAA